MNSGKLVVFVLLLSLAPHCAFAWGNRGHEAVVAVALATDPTLEPRVDAILKKMSSSNKWRALKKTGLKNPNPFETEKSDPPGWIRALGTNPEKAATFPDWARDYKGYVSSKYDKIHFYDLDYNDENNLRFVGSPNALDVLEPFEKDLKMGGAGARAWALTWVFHIVGDLHQPLHTTARQLATNANKSDNGGNGVQYKGDTLHHFWDHLPDKPTNPGVDLYAQALLLKKAQLGPAQRAAFDAKSNDLDPRHWVREGHDLIVKIGYPADNKVTNYDKSALEVADQQILLAGTRLAKILQQNLP